MRVPPADISAGLAQGTDEAMLCAKCAPAAQSAHAAAAPASARSVAVAHAAGAAIADRGKTKPRSGTAVLEKNHAANALPSASSQKKMMLIGAGITGLAVAGLVAVFMSGSGKSKTDLARSESKQPAKPDTSRQSYTPPKPAPDDHAKPGGGLMNAIADERVKGTAPKSENPDAAKLQKAGGQYPAKPGDDTPAPASSAESKTPADPKPNPFVDAGANPASPLTPDDKLAENNKPGGRPGSNEPVNDVEPAAPVAEKPKTDPVPEPAAPPAAKLGDSAAKTQDKKPVSAPFKPPVKGQFTDMFPPDRASYVERDISRYDGWSWLCSVPNGFTVKDGVCSLNKMGFLNLGNFASKEFDVLLEAEIGKDTAIGIVLGNANEYTNILLVHGQSMTRGVIDSSKTADNVTFDKEGKAHGVKEQWIPLLITVRNTGWEVFNSNNNKAIYKTTPTKPVIVPSFGFWLFGLNNSQTPAAKIRKLRLKVY
jgi:hypothetical protein